MIESLMIFLVFFIVGTLLAFFIDDIIYLRNNKDNDD